jgi:chloramphenicol 3-O phosphotransferase
MATASLIVLSGPSCAGKTSIVWALQEILEEPYLYVGLDHFEAMQPVKGGQRTHLFYGQAADRTWHPEKDLVHVMHQCVATFAAEGANVIVEHIFLKRRWLRDAVLRFSDYPVLFVGVQCPLAELERRERERYGGNLTDSQSARHLNQLGAIDRLAPYDVVVDTSRLSAEECARQIVRRLREGPMPTGFQQLRASPFLDEDE